MRSASPLGRLRRERAAPCFAGRAQATERSPRNSAFSWGGESLEIRKLDYNASGNFCINSQPFPPEICKKGEQAFLSLVSARESTDGNAVVTNDGGTKTKKKKKGNKTGKHSAVRRNDEVSSLAHTKTPGTPKRATPQNVR